MLGIIKHLIIDLIRHTSVVYDFFKIKKEISYGRKYLEILQKNKLSQLLIFIANNVPFYMDRLKNYSKEDLINKPFYILNELPVISKEDYINDINVFLPSKKRAFIINHTGGSTGEPFEYLVDLKSVSRTKAFDLFLWNHAINYRFGDKIAVIAGSSLGNNNNNFRLRIYNFLQSKVFFEGGFFYSDQILKNVKKLCSNNFDIVYAYPSSLLKYIEIALNNNISFNGKLKGIITTSETLTKNIREEIEDFFKTKVYDVYGARDGGIVADECSQRDGFHFNMQDCIVEEFNEYGNKNHSELLLTNLESFSMPFVRYRVGDIGKISYEVCSCKLPLPKIINFEGRTRDIITLPSGIVIHGSIFNKIFYKYKDIKQYQIIYDGHKLKGKIITRSYNNELIKLIRQDIFDTLHCDIEIELSNFSDLFYTQSGKLKSIIVKNN